MAIRFPAEKRREQISQVVLGLLSEVPVERVTTRLIAETMGVTQPALFRHFDSRDEIFARVVEDCRAALLLLSGSVEAPEPLQRVHAYLRALVAFVEERPGLPRLLFYDASGGNQSGFHHPLRELVRLQGIFVSALLQEAKAAGTLPSTLDEKQAGLAFVSFIQGSLLQWLQSERQLSLEGLVESAHSIWRAGVGQGVPALNRLFPSQEKQSVPHLGQLDVRPGLAEKREPLADILRALDEIAEDGLLEVLVPFKPLPLLQLLEQRGVRTQLEQLEPHLFRLWALKRESSALLDLRQREAPEPLECVLLAVQELGPGESLCAAVPRLPRLLFPQLKRRGLVWEVHESVDGCALLWLQAPVAHGA